MARTDPLDETESLRLIDSRRDEVRERLTAIEVRLRSVRAARGEWTDEEHDPEGFTLTHEWSQAEGARADLQGELVELQDAATRVRDGIFGVCTACGRDIPVPQLERRPARRTCVACTDGALRR